MIDFGALDFSECRSEEDSDQFYLTLSVYEKLKVG